MYKSITYSIFVALLLCITQSFAQVAENTSKPVTILGISVEGNNFVDAQTIITLSNLHIGDVINLLYDTKIQEATLNIWKRNQFHKVKIKIDKITEGGVFLVIEVEEYPRINDIIIKDNEKINTKDLMKEVQKNKGEILSNYDTMLIKKRLKEAYNKEGLAFAQISPEVRYTDLENYVDLYLFIDEGTKFKVHSITFEGNSHFSDKKLAKAFKKTKTKDWWQFWRSAKFDEKKYQEDKKLLDEFFKKNGSIDGEIISDSVSYDMKKGWVNILINVKEGNQYFVRNIDFEGNTIYPDELLRNRLNFKKGDVYDAEKFKKNLEGNEEQSDAASLYLDNGYLQARFIPNEVHVASDSVDIKVYVYEGQRFKIGKVDIVGNTKTKDKVIRRELFTMPGDYFDRSAVIRSIRALGLLNYFNPEKLQPNVAPSKIDNTSVDIVYNVEERSTDTFNASIGYAGVIGLTASIGLTFNNFSLAEPFRGGNGQVLNLNVEVGQLNRYQTFSLRFIEPWLYDEPTTLGFNLFDTRYSDYFYMRRSGGTINLGRRFKWPDDYWRGDWDFRVMYNDVDETTQSSFIPGLEVAISQQFTRISLNNQFFPSIGSKFTFSNTFAMGALGIGKTDYFKTDIGFDIYNPLMQIKGQDRLVLMLSSKWGYIVGLKSDSTIPPIERYYMGGSGISIWGVTPMRGYTERSFGPDDGSYVLSKYTTELRFAVTMDPYPIYFYAFAEAGNIWQSFRKTDPFNLRRSAGIGVQLYIMPLGMIGFSYGYGFDPVYGATKPSGWQFLFNIGQQ
ncbi:MAG TPA: outer membrane protein assembly factor BamA [Bacteroidota bacterium]|nr:outer membrane protein assembly factor BamA [Bacteroidota bacterium]